LINTTSTALPATIAGGTGTIAPWTGSGLVTFPNVYFDSSNSLNETTGIYTNGLTGRYDVAVTFTYTYTGNPAFTAGGPPYIALYIGNTGTAAVPLPGMIAYFTTTSTATAGTSDLALSGQLTIAGEVFLRPGDQLRVVYNQNGTTFTVAGTFSNAVFHWSLYQITNA